MVHQYTSMAVGLFNHFSPRKLVPIEHTNPKKFQKKNPIVKATTADLLAYPEFSLSSSTSTTTNIGITASSDYDFSLGWENPWMVDKSNYIVNILFTPYLKAFYDIATILELYFVKVNLAWSFILAELDFFNLSTDVNIKKFDEICYSASLDQVNLSLEVEAEFEFNECTWSLLEFFQTGTTTGSCGYVAYGLDEPVYMPSVLPAEMAE